MWRCAASSSMISPPPSTPCVVSPPVCALAGIWSCRALFFAPAPQSEPKIPGLARVMPWVTDGVYRLTGQKAFGSGSGMTSYMLTTAMPEEEDQLQMCSFWTCGTWRGTARRGRPPRQQRGMATAWRRPRAMRSRFADFLATRIAWPGHVPHLMEGAGGHNQSLFTAVIVGIVETALEAARRAGVRRREALRAYERVEWTKAEQERLAHQASLCGRWRRTGRAQQRRAREDGNCRVGRGGHGLDMPGRWAGGH